MFDEQNFDKKGQTPNNLPTAEPVDMFAGVDNSVSAVGVGKLQPKTSSDLNDAKIQVMPEEAVRLNKIKNPTFAKNLMIFVIALVGIGILGGGSWLVYTYFVKPPVKIDNFGLPADIQVLETEDQNMAPVPAPAVEDVASEAVVDVNEAIQDDAALFGEPIDSDFDNLSDIREAELGADPKDWDTDNDDLGDGDEVLVWKTNPLNPDTDGDTFLDGVEIKNGYNPAGAGKIFELPQQ